MPDKQTFKTIAQNKKARHDYFIEESFEAGIELCGTEVKSLRQGSVNLKDSYCAVRDGEIFVRSMHISPYEKGNIFNRDPLRDRRLLMHKREILRPLRCRQKRRMRACFPYQFILRGRGIKIQIALAKGKHLYDKREDMAKRDAEREMDRSVKERNK